MSSNRRLTLRDVQNRMLDLEHDQIQIYEHILDAMYELIEKAIQFQQIFCVYQIPQIIPGKPMFNMTNCVMYIIKHFKQNGFDAKYHHPFTIIVRWPPPNYMAMQARAIMDGPTQDIHVAAAAAAAPTVPTYSQLPITQETDNIEAVMQQRHRDNIMFEYIPKKRL